MVFTAQNTIFVVRKNYDFHAMKPMTREIWRLTIPNIVSNVTVPLLGMADMAIAGRLGDSTATIGALAIGTTIFNFIYWNCSFLRMGTSGLTAQAFGAGRKEECANLLVRGVVVAVALAVVLIALQRPVGEFAIWLMNGNDLVRRYFFARIWAVPAAISLFALNGWFIGMQNSSTPMLIALAQNVINIAFSIWFAFGLDMGLEGVAWGTVVAQYSGVVLAVVAIVRRYRDVVRLACWRSALRLQAMGRFFTVNRDIFIRSFCLCVAYSFFTAAGARMGDPTILAVNSLMMQLFSLFSYMSDGVAYAAEALTGRFVGARDADSLSDAAGRMFRISLVIALAYVAVYTVGWEWLLGLFVDGDPNETAAIMATAARYRVWVILSPLVGFAPFLMDGIMIGATMTRILRNSMVCALALYFAIFFSLRGVWGNDALWLAFLLFMVARGVLQYLMAGGIRGIIPRAEQL